MKQKRFISIGILTLTIVLMVAAFWSFKRPSGGSGSTTRPLKLYWFIPDGFRSDPVVFRVFQWAREGLLPNIRHLMDNGSYGYSIPVFPGHTPTNFSTLLTGSTPRVHGVSDGSMRTEGYPLRMVSKSGFSSVAKKVEPLWYTLEAQNLLVTLLSIPGSTPPELNAGITIRGRWGGWGLDFPAINFHSAADQRLRALQQGIDTRLFGFGSDLTKFVPSQTPGSWPLGLPASHSPPYEVELRNWGETLHAYVYDSSDDEEENYDAVILSKDKKTVFAQLKEGEWSNWLPVHLQWETQNDYNTHTPKRMAWERSLSAVSVDTEVKIKIIKLGNRDSFRIRFFYNNLNEHLVKPSSLAKDIIRSVGPMVDFVDNYPPQLIYFPEDKRTFLEEAELSLQWHERMAGHMIRETGSDVIIHSIYTPNQMLTSRWWMPYLDPKSPRYGDISDREREGLWTEVKQMYQGIDAIIGRALKSARPDTYFVLSSDHGAVPLHTEVLLNNVFAREGLLKTKKNAASGEQEIDWKNTQAVFLQMDNIYLNPDGLGGNYRRASGKRYEDLRQKVITILSRLEDAPGARPLSRVLKWEDAHMLDLPEETVGDLIVANRPGYGWVENITLDRAVFTRSLKGGYKQAILADTEEGMWTPLIISGPGVRKNFQLAQPVRHIDQYPTVMRLLGKPPPSFVEGKALEMIFKKASGL